MHLEYNSLIMNLIPRYALNVSDPDVLRDEPFNVTFDDVWYFAPRFYVAEHFPLLACLIWTSPFTKSRPRDWIILVFILYLYVLPISTVQWNLRIVKLFGNKY